MLRQYFSGSITVLRHAYSEGTTDESRVLTPEGIRQAIARRKQLEDPKYDLVICSNRKRTCGTASIIAGPGSNEERIKLPQLFDQTCGIMRIGENQWKAVSDVINTHQEARKILIVGHDIFITALGVCMLEEIDGHMSVNVFKDLVFDETEDYTMNIHNSALTRLDHHKNC